MLKKPLGRAPPRLQRLMLRLQRYAFSFKYKPGKELFLADTLSRQIDLRKKQTEEGALRIDSSLEKEMEAQAHKVVSNINVSESKLR